jgi:cytidine deaminase
MEISSEMQERLVQTATQARRWAYVPYSHYAVGAALLTQSGKIYEGVNIENAAYPQTICAERVAVFKAVSEGERQFQAIAVVTENGGTPCGGCRQVLVEFGTDTIVLLANTNGEIKKNCTVADLLPFSFGPESLPTDG